MEAISLIWGMCAGIIYIEVTVANPIIYRCLPKDFSIAQGDFKHNYSAVPDGVFSGCKSSEGQQEVLKVDPAAQYASWDLISSAGTSTFVFSIDEHPLYVYAIDGRYVKPIKADALTITNGERYSIMVKLDKPADKKYAVRSVVTGLNQLLNTTAVLEYDSSCDEPFTSSLKNTYPTSRPYITVSGLNATANTVMYNSSLATPFPPVAPAAEANDLYVLKIGRYNASYRWFLNNGSMPLNLEVARPPLLFDDPNVYTNTSKNGIHNNGDNLTIHTLHNSWIDLILAIEPPFQPPHPFHKHSNKFFVIGSGQGVWKWPSVTDAVKETPGSFNLVDPPTRDTFATIVPTNPLTGSSWVAIRYHVVNPGAFLLHCHIQAHLAGGMALALLDGVDKWPKIPQEYLHGNGI
jgi:FtsP/CotA-like multicopper oxidase with cupredoxin domain